MSDNHGLIPIALIGAGVGWNIHNDEAGLSTFCSKLRECVPPPILAAGVGTFFGWIFPHLLQWGKREAGV